jgi:hypothetical protein
MITRPEAKSIADAFNGGISPARRAEIEQQLDTLIRDAAATGAYEVMANILTKDYNEQELVFARDLLRNAPNLFHTLDFANDSDHWIYWN